MNRRTENILLIIILAVAAFLRFFHLGITSFSNDELSALTRARYDSFGELVREGIIQDYHPALTQIIIWYIIHIFNDEVFTIRFLFASAGIGSVYLIYLVGKQWFGSWCGLLSAAALGALQFPLLYSQIARPYSFGLFFVLLLTYYWTKILFNKELKFRDSVMYVLSMSACMYTHYFAFMVAGIIGMTGLFCIRKNTARRYLLLNTAVLLLYIPYLNIFLTQMSYGGLSSWLSKPDGDFIWNFLYYCFNRSAIVVLSVIFLFLFSLFKSRAVKSFTKYHLFSLLWFMLPFIIGYYYSVNINPVLQYSTLLFAFPFLVIFSFSFFSAQIMRKSSLLLLIFVLLSGVTLSTVFEKKYYQVNHFGEFKALAEKSKLLSNKYGNANIAKLYTLINPDYIGYYFHKYDYEPQNSVYVVDERENFADIRNFIDSTSSEYFLYAWTNIGHYYETLELIQSKFALVATRDTFFNSEVTLFQRGNVRAKEVLFSSFSDYESTQWGDEEKIRTDEAAHSGRFSQKLNESDEYSLTFRKDLITLNAKPDDVAIAEVWFQAKDSLGDATLVLSFSKGNETVLWSGMSLRHFQNSGDEWQRAILYSKLPDDKNTVISMYVWNPSKKFFYIDDLKLIIKKKNSLYRTV